jgi:hypothetical protein
VSTTWTEAEALRISTIESALNKLQTSVSSLTDKSQLQQLLLLKQSAIEDLQQRVAVLEQMISLLEGLL